MHARVWEFHILSGKLDEFSAAVESLVPLAQREGGFRGVLVLRNDAGEKPVVTLIAVWDSLEALRGSEKHLFVMQAFARLLVFSDGVPAIREHEVLLSDFFPSVADQTAGEHRA